MSSSLTLRSRSQRLDYRRWLRRHSWTLAAYLLAALLLGVEKIVHPTLDNFDLQSLAQGALPLALAAMAQGVIVISGGIDLSLGAMMSLVNVVSAFYMVNAGIGQALAISAAILTGTALLGALSGWVMTLTRVPDIIVTLATSFIWVGFAQQIMPTAGGGAPQEFQDLLMGQLGPLPTELLVVAIVLVVAWLPLLRTRLGLAIYAIGSNRNAAYLSGVSVARTRIAAYAIGGLFTGLAGLTLTASTLNGNYTSGTTGAGYTLNSVAAIVVGGVALTGGRGGLLGPVAAAIILTELTTLLTFLGVDSNVAQIIQGALIVLIVMAAGLLLLRRRR